MVEMVPGAALPGGRRGAGLGAPSAGALAQASCVATTSDITTAAGTPPMVNRLVIITSPSRRSPGPAAGALAHGRCAVVPTPWSRHDGSRAGETPQTGRVV